MTGDNFWSIQLWLKGLSNEKKLPSNFGNDDDNNNNNSITSVFAAILILVLKDKNLHRFTYSHSCKGLSNKIEANISSLFGSTFAPRVALHCCCATNRMYISSRFLRGSGEGFQIPVQDFQGFKLLRYFIWAYTGSRLFHFCSFRQFNRKKILYFCGIRTRIVLPWWMCAGCHWSATTGV